MSRLYDINEAFIQALQEQELNEGLDYGNEKMNITTSGDSEEDRAYYGKNMAKRNRVRSLDQAKRNLKRAATDGRIGNGQIVDQVSFEDTLYDDLSTYKYRKDMAGIHRGIEPRYNKYLKVNGKSKLEPNEHNEEIAIMWDKEAKEVADNIKAKHNKKEEASKVQGDIIKYKGFVIEVDEVNTENNNETIVFIYKDEQALKDGDYIEQVSLNTDNLEQNVKDYIDEVYGTEKEIKTEATLNLDDIYDEYKEAYHKELDIKRVPCVIARDKMLSGWGRANGATQYQMVLCADRIEAENIASNMEIKAKSEGLANIRVDFGIRTPRNGSVSYSVGRNARAWNMSDSWYKRYDRPIDKKEEFLDADVNISTGDISSNLDLGGIGELAGLLASEEKKNSEEKLVEEDVKMRTEELHTDLLPIIDAYQYGIGDNLLGITRKDINEAMAKVGGEIIKNVIKSILPTATVTIKDMYNPAYYRFGSGNNDQLDFDITVPEADYEALKDKTIAKEDFEEFLRNTYKSYDGFSSTMPQSMKDFEEAKDWEQFVAVLSYYITPYEYQNDFIADVNEEIEEIGIDEYNAEELVDEAVTKIPEEERTADKIREIVKDVVNPTEDDEWFEDKMVDEYTYKPENKEENKEIKVEADKNLYDKIEQEPRTEKFEKGLKIKDEIVNAWKDNDLKTAYAKWEELYDLFSVGYDNNGNRTKDFTEEQALRDMIELTKITDQIEDKCVYDVTDYGKAQAYKKMGY